MNCTGQVKPRLGGCTTIPGMLVRREEPPTENWRGERVAARYRPCSCAVQNCGVKP